MSVFDKVCKDFGTLNVMVPRNDTICMCKTNLSITLQIDQKWMCLTSSLGEVATLANLQSPGVGLRRPNYKGRQHGSRHRPPVKETSWSECPKYTQIASSLDQDVEGHYLRNSRARRW